MRKNVMLILLAIGFFLFGYVAMLKSRPEPKPKRVMQKLLPYMPFKLQKSFGGLNIVDTRNDTKYTPSNTEVFHKLDELERGWGKTHLHLQGDRVIVMDDLNKTVGSFRLKSQKERAFMHSFFGI